jgi:hypothetical protein
MTGDRLGDALAAPKPGGQQVELVGLVGRRAGGADRGPAVAAGFEEGGVRLPASVIDRADLAALRVGVLDGAPQPHRVDAVAGLGDQLHPAVIAGAGPVDDLLKDAR